jgi:hypothetical protein
MRTETRSEVRGHVIPGQSSRVRRAGLGGRRPATGPRPSRPGVVPVGVRPLQPARPAVPGGAPRPSGLAVLASSLGSGLLGSGLLGPVRRAEQRVLARRGPVAGPVAAARRRGALVVAALVAVTATCVVLLGLLADAVSEARSGAAAAGVAAITAPARIAATETGAAAPDASTVTVGSEETVWEVAQRVAPDAEGPEVAALAQRLVADNGLASVRVHPGQVLRVTSR